MRPGLPRRPDTGEKMQRPESREFRGWTRFRADEAIWPAQVVTWLPMMSQVVALTVLLFTIIGGGFHMRHNVGAALASLLVILLFLSLYYLAGAWIGERQRRGIQLATALFAWSLAADALFGRLITLGAAYDVLALVLVIRAGRAIGVRWTGRLAGPPAQ